MAATSSSASSPPAGSSSSSSARYDVAVVGLGDTGLVTALSFHAAGSRVLGLEAEPSRIAEIRGGAVELVSEDAARLARALADPRGFVLTTEATQLALTGTVMVCRPDPIEEACRDVVEHAVAGQVIVLTSTDCLKCTDDPLAAPLADRGLRVGDDVHVVYCPSR